MSTFSQPDNYEPTLGQHWHNIIVKIFYRTNTGPKLAQCYNTNHQRCAHDDSTLVLAFHATTEEKPTFNETKELPVVGQML